MNYIPIILVVILVVAAVVIAWPKARKQAPIRTNPTDLINQPPSGLIGRPQTMLPQPNGLTVGDAQRPAITILPYLPRSEDQQAPLTLRQEQTSVLEGLLRHIPGLALAGANLGSQTYVVRFAPEVAQRLASGSATLMDSLGGGVRAIAVGGDGKIIGQGTLIAQTGLQTLASAVAIWQLLAMVTAQYYLVTIQRQLASIEQKLDAIQARMDDQEAATLINNFKRLRSIQVALAEYRLTELDIQSSVIEVDTIDRECGRIMETCLLGMGRDTKRMQSMNLQGTFDPAYEVGVAVRCVDSYTQTAQVWSMAALTRIVAAETRCALPLEREIAHQRLNDIQRELEHWNADYQAFTKLVIARSRDISRAIHIKVWENPRAYREKLLKAARHTRYQLYNSNRQIKDGLVDVQDMVAAQQILRDQPLNLLVDVNPQGQITTMRRLLALEAEANHILNEQAAEQSVKPT